MTADRRAVAVVAAGLWTSPDVIRPIDAPALSSPALIREWAAAQGPRLALDCSGLIHLLYRRYGHVIPRDAADKIAVGEEVAIEDLESGDLLFFAKPDTGFVYHCGICVDTRTGRPAMLHVSQTDWACLDGPVSDVRLDHLIAGRRLRS